MGRDLTMVALDSNAMTYWIAALSSVPGPPAEPCVSEKMALARIFMWSPRGSGLWLTPTVQRECEAIKERDRLANYLDWALAHLSQVNPPQLLALLSRSLRRTKSSAFEGRAAVTWM